MTEFPSCKFNFYLYVDDTGIEPVTPSMSRKCATAALIVRGHTKSTGSAYLSTKIIFDPFNIVFTKVGTCLYFNKDDIAIADILNAM